jgi:TolA-binding protein
MCLAVLCLLALAVDPAAGQGGKDNIKLKAGQNLISVKITKETYKAVEIQGKPAVKPWQIESIKHGNTPLDFISGESALRTGQYERAVEKFTKAVKDRNAPAWVKHYGAYFVAFCKHKMAEGQPAALARAAAEYQKVIDANKNGIKVPDAKFGIGQCYYQANKLPEAAAAFDEIAKSDYGDFWKLKGKIWLGRILLDQGKGAEAAKIFDEVQQKAPKDKMPEIYFEAQLSRAQGLILDDKFEDARKLLKSVFDEAEDDAIKAGAHNGLGDAFRAEKKIQEARLEYLRTIVLYLGAAEQRARALFYAADCFEQLKDAQNARRFRNTLKQEYPESVWAKRLR